MADRNPTRRTARTTPPEVGRNMSVRVLDEDDRDDLAVIMRAHGGDLSDAIRHAAHLLANAYRRAWDYGDVPDGTAPHVIAIRYAREDGEPDWMPNPADTAHPHIREVAPAS